MKYLIKTVYSIICILVMPVYFFDSFGYLFSKSGGSGHVDTIVFATYFLLKIIILMTPIAIIYLILCNLSESNSFKKLKINKVDKQKNMVDLGILMSVYLYVLILIIVIFVIKSPILTGVVELGFCVLFISYSINRFFLKKN